MFLSFVCKDALNEPSMCVCVLSAIIQSQSKANHCQIHEKRHSAFNNIFFVHNIDNRTTDTSH